jgi:hypothetical protein
MVDNTKNTNEVFSIKREEPMPKFFPDYLFNPPKKQHTPLIQPQLQLLKPIFNNKIQPFSQILSNNTNLYGQKNNIKMRFNF